MNNPNTKDDIRKEEKKEFIVTCIEYALVLSIFFVIMLWLACRPLPTPSPAPTPSPSADAPDLIVATPPFTLPSYIEYLEKYIAQNENTYSSKEPDGIYYLEPITNLTAEEINLIELLVECEVGDNPLLQEQGYNLYYANLAVANVVLNRYRTDYWEFPDTIEGVIFQEKQFTPVGSKAWETKIPSNVTKEAVHDALNGKMIVGIDTYWFCTLDCSAREWFEKNLELYGEVGPHVFYRLPDEIS